MIFSPNTIEPIINFLTSGTKAFYLMGFGLFVVNVFTYFQMVTEAKLRRLNTFHTKLVKLSMFINVVVPPLVYLKLGKLHLGTEVYLYSIFCSLIIYVLVYYASNKKT
jgi:hypothetical protein